MDGTAEQIRLLRDAVPFYRIGLLVLAGLALDALVRVVARRVIARIDERRASGGDVERHQRGATLVGATASVARIIVWVSVALSILSQLNINVGPIVAGAGVVGAALVFGAQNIVKDYLAGFFILLENQYTLGDVVKIAGVSGTVEDITMRVTVLRGGDGAMHVIPNGTIQIVSNVTRVWARAVVEVGIGYGARLDAVLAALEQVGAGLYDDPAWRPRLLERPEVPGVVAFQDVNVTVRVQAKVVPDEQWNVKNELSRRIKDALDAIDHALPAHAPPIVAPLPRRTAQRE